MTAEMLRRIFDTLQWYGNLATYMAPRIGGVLAGCPRGELPKPNELVRPALALLKDFEPVAIAEIEGKIDTATYMNAMHQACEAAKRYDQAIRRRCEDGDIVIDARVAIAEGQDLDSLYGDWMAKVYAALAMRGDNDDTTH